MRSLSVLTDCLLSFVFYAMRPDFPACETDFLNGSSDIYSKHVYNGSVQGLLKAAGPVPITVEGCRQLCGT